MNIRITFRLAALILLAHGSWVYAGNEARENTTRVRDNDFVLGTLYWQNEKLRDLDKARHHMNLSARRGNAEAMLALYHLESKENPATALEWLRKSADAGLGEAECELGDLYCTGGKYQEALHWLNKAAAQGVGMAQFLLGNCYLHGLGVPADDKRAFALVSKAAEQGVPEAQQYMGRFYEAGKVVARDPETAYQWFSKAAAQSDPAAQYQLGACYLSGDGVTMDKQKGKEWIEKAAAQGLLDAQFITGVIYLKGNIVPRDEDKGGYWLHKAALSGDNESALYWQYYLHKKIGKCEIGNLSRIPRKEAEATRDSQK